MTSSVYIVYFSVAEELGYEGDEETGAWVSLCMGNGDGADYIVVSELVDSDTLVEVEMDVAV